MALLSAIPPPSPCAALPASGARWNLHPVRRVRCDWQTGGRCALFGAAFAYRQSQRKRSARSVAEWPAGAGECLEDCGMVSLQGVDPDRPKDNQAVVLDGHGKKGHVVSGALKAFLPDLLTEQLASGKHDIPTAMRMAFMASDATLREKGVGQSAWASGAAALAAVVERGATWHIDVACAGDCHAWLLEKVEGRWRGSSISQASSCERERDRLEAAGARVSKGILWAGPIGVAMSRALGDLALRPFGLLCEPELQEISGQNEAFLCL
ncbi:unnamed protein product, partial [Durusdinium trenchii]